MHLKTKIALAGLALLLGGAACARDVLIDVRSGQEFEGGHLKGAINMPHTTVPEEIAKAGVNGDDHIMLYCQSGRRSGMALDALKAAGYTQVENYGGMAQAQTRLKLPVTTGN